MLLWQLKSWQTELQNLICSTETPLTSVKPPGFCGLSLPGSGSRLQTECGTCLLMICLHCFCSTIRLWFSLPLVFLPVTAGWASWADFLQLWESAALEAGYRRTCSDVLISAKRPSSLQYSSRGWERRTFCQPHTAEGEERCVLFLSVFLYHIMEKFLVFKVVSILTGIYPDNNYSTDKGKLSLNSFSVIHYN